MNTKAEEKVFKSVLTICTLTINSGADLGFYTDVLQVAEDIE